MTELNVKQIRIDGGTQARAEIDKATVADYVELLQEYPTIWPFPAVIVFYDGTDYWLADGFHRITAARQHGRFVCQADVRQGTRRDAILFAAGANADHGLKRSAEDKRRAVLGLLADEEWGAWSDREIARHCKVSHPYVAKIREETGNVTSERTYTDRHGNKAKMKTANIGGKADDDDVVSRAKQQADDCREIVKDGNGRLPPRNCPRCRGRCDAELIGDNHWRCTNCGREYDENRRVPKAEEETAVAAPTPADTKPMPVWELEQLVKAWMGSVEIKTPGIATPLDALMAIKEKYVGWRVTFDSIKATAGTRLCNDGDLKQAINNVISRHRSTNSNGKTAVAPADPEAADACTDCNGTATIRYQDGSMYCYSCVSLVSVPPATKDEANEEPGSLLHSLKSTEWLIEEMMIQVKAPSSLFYALNKVVMAVRDAMQVAEATEVKVAQKTIYAEWLRTYQDDSGRTWSDLTTSQTNHANSPCYQAFTKAFPGEKEPKFMLKYARAQLERETAVSQEVTP